MTNPSTPIPTPRVDALDFEDQMKFPGPGYGELWELARNLERELTAARSEIAFLTAFADPPDVKTGETSRSQLERELQQAQAELEKYRGLYHAALTSLDSANVELAAARAMNKKLREYARHKRHCRTQLPYLSDCTCGLEELLR